MTTATKSLPTMTGLSKEDIALIYLVTDKVKDVLTVERAREVLRCLRLYLMRGRKIQELRTLLVEEIKLIQEQQEFLDRQQKA